MTYAHKTKITFAEPASTQSTAAQINLPVHARPPASHQTLSLVVAITLAYAITGGGVTDAFAQNLEVDVSDPNVSVDLSVLDDGGLGGGISAGVPGTMAPVHALPGTKGYISELYISPKGGIDLPPPGHPRKETKPAEIEQAIAETSPMADDTQPSDVAEVTEVEEVEEAVVEVAPAAPAAPEQVVSETSESTTESVAESTPAPAPAAEETTAMETSETAPEAETAVASAPTEPAPAPLTPETVPAPAQPAEQAPEPAQPATPEATALVETAPPPPAAPATDAAKVVVELPQPAVQETPAPAETQQASLPPADGPLQVGDALRIPFDAGASKLPDNAREGLKSLAARLQAQDSLRLQLLAYAGGDDLSASKARRLSLSRALSVRSFLIESGVRSTRIDVRALGNKVTDSTPNRVDVNVVER